MQLTEHAEKNRIAWTKFSAKYRESAHRAWSKPAPDWGIWRILESEVQAFAGLDLRGKDIIELGCGTAYFSAWLHRMGAHPVGIDITPAQLETAHELQREFGIEFPLIEASAEQVPLPDNSFDLAISEYGASIWCDPYLWIPEAARLLRPGGTLVFLRNGTLSMVCMPDVGSVTTSLQRDVFGLHRLDWEDDGSVEFHINASDMVRLLRKTGFEIEDLIYLQAPEGATTKFEYMDAEWARRWPSEEIWRAKLKA